jgi:hypothetical protein
MMALVREHYLGLCLDNFVAYNCYACFACVLVFASHPSGDHQYGQSDAPY